jgi:serine/threonine-protein kinase
MDMLATLTRSLAPHYQVERELGRGGMSQLFLAREITLDRRVVVKVLPAELAAGVSVDRFKREIMLAASLQHPNIVGILAAGDVDGLPYFVMPYVEGRSLRDRLASEGRLSVPETVRLLRDVARGLAYAHARGIVHRDVKPDNVLLSGGAAMLTDFGVAKALSSAHLTPRPGDPTLTSVGMSLGTPTYMAPEQAAADTNVDHRADLYAFGIMAYEVLVGAPPFENRPVAQILVAHISEPPTPLSRRRPEIPAALAALIMRCLEKDPNRRPQAADELVAALDDPATVSGPVASVTVPSVTASPVTAADPRRWMRWAAAAGALAAVVVLAAVALRRGPPRGDSPHTVAVLPFANVSRDTADQYLADGLTDHLTGALTKVPGLRVASRTAASRFGSGSASVEEIARALNATALLEGTVQRAGGRVRLSARLVNAADGLTLWAETYDRQSADVLAIQDSISSAIVAALADALGTGQPAVSPAPRHAPDPEAYDLYLRGRFFLAKRGPDAIAQALDHFERATARDPAYAEAHAGMADALSLVPLYTDTPLDSVFPRALRAADRAVALDSGLAAAVASRAVLLNGAWQWEAAERDFTRALTLDSTNATVHQWFGEHLLVRGRIAEGARHLGRAAELEPLSPVITGSHALGLALLAEADEARRRVRRAVELDPDLAVTRFLAAAVYLYLDQADSAIAMIEPAVRQGAPVVATGLLGYAFAVTGQPQRAAAELATLDTLGTAAWMPSAVARIHLGLGDVDAALTWLERAAERRDPHFSSETMASPVFDRLRGEPRFLALVGRVGLDPEVLGRPQTGGRR